LLAGHSVFRSLDPKVVSQMTLARVAIDTVNVWPTAAWQEAGFKVYRLGLGNYDCH